MSATNRGALRRPDDFYSTPAEFVRPILPFLPLSGRILEPSAGTGAIVSVLLEVGVPRKQIDAHEIDPVRAGFCDARCLDFLEVPAAVGRWDLVIGNPPFSLAREFIDKARELSDTVAFLLRLNFLGSQKRAGWLRGAMPDVYVMPKRPSFTGNGKTDATEYAWFVWRPGGGGRLSILEVGK